MSKNGVKKFTIGSTEKDLWITVYARGWKDIKKICKKRNIKDSITQCLGKIKGKSKIISIEKL